MDTEVLQEIQETFMMLSQLEASMARYYLSCSEKWAEHGALWMDLAVEEEKHEKIIGDLSDIVARNPDRFETGFRVERSAVESYVATIDEMTSDVLKGRTGMVDALTFALGMEESMLEGRYFDIVRSENPRFCRLVEILAGDLARHRQEIIDKIAELRSKGQ